MISPLRHLVIRTFGRQLARRVQKMPVGRWGFIDARSTSVRKRPGRAERHPTSSGGAPRTG
jgi:hypothetical protein